MKEELFQELVASVREGGAILRGEQNPSRQFAINATDIKRIRENYRLSQGQFAVLLGISVATLQNWEQGRRAPKGAASVLLQVAAKHPDAVWDVVKPAVRISATRGKEDESYERRGSLRMPRLDKPKRLLQAELVNRACLLQLQNLTGFEQWQRCQ